MKRMFMCLCCNALVISLSAAGVGQVSESKPTPSLTMVADSTLAADSARRAAATAEFAPTTVTVVAGNQKAGDVSSVAAQDGEVLKIKSVKLDGSFGDIVEYDFTTNLDPGTPDIAFSILQRITVAPQQEQMSVFDYSTGAFHTVNPLTISFTVSTVTVLRIQNPIHFISPNGELRLQVRLGDSDTTRWKHLVDQVSLSTQ